MSSAAAADRTLAGGRRADRQLDDVPRVARTEATLPMAALQAGAGHVAVQQLLGHGMPLPRDVRAEMEARFSTSFADVRVHADGSAQTAAAAMHAKAWTCGNDVGFDQGRFAPSSVEGRQLLAHELAHVIQQRRGGGAPPWQRGAFNEVAADRAAAAVVHGSGQVAVEGASGVGVARAEADGPSAAGDDATTAMMNRFRRSMLDAMLAGAGYAGPGPLLVAKANEGFSDQAFKELWREGKGKDLLMKFLSLGFSGVAQAAVAFQAGVVEGALSPITDAVRGLFGAGVLVESGRNLAWGLLKSAYNASGALGPEIEKLLADSNALAARTRDSLSALVNDPDSVKWLLSLPEAAEKAVQQKAYELGAAGASKVVSTLESPWSEDEPQAEAEPELGLSTLASYVYSKAGSTVGAVHDYFMSSPGAQIGESIGYAVGVAAVQVLLLVTSAGTAEIVEGLGVALAKVATVLARFSSTAGRAVGGAGELVALLGGAIRVVESASTQVVGAMKEGLAKVFKPLVDQLKEWFGSALALIKKVLGMAEKEMPSPALVSPKVTNPTHLPASSAGPTLVPPDTNGPTLVPDGSDWDDEATELKIAPVRDEPDRGPGAGLTTPKAETTLHPDAPASTTFVPDESAGSPAGSDWDDEKTELKIAPVRDEPDRGPGPGLRTPKAEHTLDPVAPASTTYVPDESAGSSGGSDWDPDAVTELKDAPASTTFVPDESLGPTPAPAEIDTDAPGERSEPTHPRAPDLNSRPPYEDLEWPANAPRRGPGVDPATREQLAQDRGPGGLRYADDPDWVDPSPDAGPRRPPPRSSPGSLARDRRQGRVTYSEPAPVTPANEPGVRDMSPEEVARRRTRVEEAQRRRRTAPDPNAPATEIRPDDDAEIIPPDEMDLIREDAYRRADWPEVVPHVDLPKTPPAPVVNRRGRRKRQP